MARWLLPTPGGPRNSALRRSSTKRSVRQLGDDRPVDRGLEVELELRQALVERVVGEAEPTRQPPGRGRLDLGRQEPLEDLDRGRPPQCLARSSSAARRSDAVARPR